MYSLRLLYSTLALTLCSAPASGAAPAPLDEAAAVRLGAKLFEDTALSADGSVSCANCHNPGQGFADHRPVSRGVGGAAGTRNAPTLLGVGRAQAFFWDGRRPSLESVMLDPLLHPREHGMPSSQAVAAVVSKRYGAAFQRAWGPIAVTPEAVALTLARFVKALGTDAPHLADGHAPHLTEAQVRGRHLFEGRAQCSRCHLTQPEASAFTDGLYHPGEVPAALMPQLATVAREVATWPEARRFAAIAERPDVAALGRFVVTLQPADIACFRTPTLRNVARTAPYMHDGSVATLREAVEREIYWRSEVDSPLGRLTPQERQDLVAFLESLSYP
jgi:cytochrome c peroxidase